MTSKRLAHIPALDGLRGAAVAAVVVFHASAALMPGGYLGVSLFFTLSGFLITAQLLYEHDRTGRIDLIAFWMRRARRLVPALIMTLLLVAVTARLFVDSQQLDELRGDGIAGLFYVANWRFIASAGSYADQFTGDANPLIHLWSLAIEEQFYLLFPLVAVVFLRWGRRGFVTALAAGIGASFLATIVLGASDAGAERIYYGTDTRAFEILVGAALAVAYVKRPELSTRARRPLAMASALALVTVAIPVATWHIDDPLVYDGGLVLFAVGSSLLIGTAVWASPMTARVFDRRPLRALGLISYGVYLYHWPIFVAVQSRQWHPAIEIPVELGLTLALAIASYALVENPIRRGAVRGPRIAVAPVAVAAVIIAFVVAVPAPGGDVIVFAAVAERDTTDTGPAVTEAADPGRGAAIETGDPSPAGGSAPRTEPPARAAPAPPASAVSPDGATTGTTGDPTDDAAGPERIMLVGDSVMLTLGRGFERWGAEADVRFANLGLLGCSVGRGGNVLVEGDVTATPAGCDDWARYWRRHLRVFDPDAVVMLTGVWDINDRLLPEWDEWKQPGDPAFDAWLADEFVAAADVLGSTGADVVWLTSPCYEKRDGSGEVVVPGGTFDVARVRHVNEVVVPALLERRPEVIGMDIYHELCPGDVNLTELDGVSPVRPDGVHFSEHGADAFAARLGPRILDALE